MKFRIAAVAFVAVSAFGAEANAQTATQTVSYEVQAINRISLAGSPSLTISSATVGGAPTSATANATYSITTNESDRKITAGIDSDMPNGVTLEMEMAAPTGGTSAGKLALSTTAVDMVTAVSLLNESGLSVEYTLSATSAAGVIAQDDKTVTFTITAGA